MARIDEIAPDLFRLSIYAPQFDLQFNHFLIKDDEPLLFHTGMRKMFPEVREAIATLIDPADLRWISWSHFEVDECGALNEWLAVAPHAQAVCSQVGAMVNIEDFANRPPRGLSKDDVIETGRHRYRFVPTPHLPHGWDAGVLFEENSGVLLCSDLFHQIGDVEPVTSTDILGRWDAAIAAYQQHPVLMDYVPLTPNTRRRLNELADLQPKVLAAMHGSTFVGDARPPCDRLPTSCSGASGRRQPMLTSRSSPEYCPADAGHPRHVEDVGDEALARRIAGGPPGSTDAEEAELYRRFAPRVRLYGRRHLRDAAAADDLAQDVLLLTFERLRAGEVRRPERSGPSSSERAG